MMSDREFEAAIRDLTALTLSDDLKWIRRAKGDALETDDLAGFAVQLAFADDDLELLIRDETGVVARVGAGDERGPAERAALEGAAFALLRLAKQKAGSEVAARWTKSVTERRS